MPVYTLEYAFRQRLAAPARAAYAWCTDFEPSDGALFFERWERSVRRVSEGTVILTDVTYPQGRLRRIHRLVRLYPLEMAWTNTHLDGPFRHSQYRYRIVADGSRRCHLEFQGSRLVTTKKTLSKAAVRRLAAGELRADSGLWRRRIAPTLKKDLTRRKPRS